MVSVKLAYFETIEELLKNYRRTYGVSTGSGTDIALRRIDNFEDNGTKVHGISTSKVVIRFTCDYTRSFTGPIMNFFYLYLHLTCSLQ